MADTIDSAPRRKRKVQATRIIKCAECGADVETNSNNRKYCDTCGHRINVERASEKLKEKYWATKTVKTFNCQVCGSEFEGRKGQNKYCSKECCRVRNLEALKDVRRSVGIRVAGSIVPCERCGDEFELTHGNSLYCAPCRKIVDRDKAQKYKDDNPEKVAEMYRKIHVRRLKDPDYREWRKNYTRIKSAERRKEPRARLDHRMSQLVRGSLKSKNGHTWESLVGYSVDELHSHIERQFLPGMSWDNMGEWHIDHILPRSMFSYETSECPDFKSCWAITNLRPLWAIENIKKSDSRLYLI